MTRVPGSAEAADPVVRLDRCSKTFTLAGQRVTALSEVSIELFAGELVVLSGPSGSGKTTLLNVLVGWEHPDEGHVLWSVDDTPPATDGAQQGPPSWDQLAIVPQRLGLLDDLSVAENAGLPLRVSGRDDPEAVVALLELLGLHGVSDRGARELSLGQQQRLSIARALVVSPLVLVADEPTGHQDDASTALVVAALLHARDTGSAALVATHDPRVTEIADRVIRLRDGRLVP